MRGTERVHTYRQGSYLRIRGEEDARDRQVNFVVLQRGSFTALQSEVSGQPETVKLDYSEAVV